MENFFPNRYRDGGRLGFPNDPEIGENMAQDYRSDAGFSIMLAKELLRRELQKLYGEGLFISSERVVGMAIEKLSPSKAPHATDIEYELCARSSVPSRIVNIVALVGPFGRIHPNNPPDDKRHHLRRVRAVCRLFSVEGGCIHWQPHFLNFGLYREDGELVEKHERVYLDGRVGNDYYNEKNADNPCEVMVASQTAAANYPAVYIALHEHLNVTSV